MEFVTEINTSQGIVECRLSRVDWYGAEVVYADLWRGSVFLDSVYTDFRAGVHLQWDGRRYTIIRSQRSPKEYMNDYWLELENLISNIIVVNE